MIQALRDSLTVLQLEIDNYPSHTRTAAADLEGHKATIIKSISAHESIISPLRKLSSYLLGPCDHFYAPLVFKSSL